MLLTSNSFARSGTGVVIDETKDIFSGQRKTRLSLGVISKHPRVFLKIKIQNWNFFFFGDGGGGRGKGGC